MHRPVAELQRERVLRQSGALETAAEFGLGQQDDEGRDRADQQGVEVDAEALDQALLDRVGDRGGGAGVGCRAHAGLVREETSADAVHEGGTETTTDDLLETEGVLDDEAEHGRNLADVEDHDDDADDQVDERQDRHDDLGDTGDAADTAEDHHADDEGDDQAHDHLEGHGLLADGTRDGVDDRIGLHRVEHESVGDGDDDREDHAHPAFP